MGHTPPAIVSEGILTKLEYDRIHKRLTMVFGKAHTCDECGTEDGRIEWAHVHDAPYMIIRRFWRMLCCKCHSAYDGTSEATRAKLSAASRGRPSSMRGKIHSDDTKAKMSKAGKGKTKSAEHRAAISKALTGRIVSEEARINNSLAQKQRPPTSEETRAKLSKAAQNRAPISEETRAKQADARREYWQRKREANK